MPVFDDVSFSVEQFSGDVRIFPLPNLVLFPHVMQPLHIFEWRYRELLKDAMADDRLIAMATLAPGWEDEYQGSPRLYPMTCLGQVTMSNELADGTCNVLVLGLCRAKLTQEVASAGRYRRAKAQLHADVYSNCDVARRKALRRELRQNLLHILPNLPEVQEQMGHLLSDNVPLGTLVDVISYLLGVDISAKQSLLTEPNVYRRVEILLDHLAGAAVGEAISNGVVKLGFPPQFSSN
jgi:uncharacterized protein